MPMVFLKTSTSIVLILPGNMYLKQNEKSLFLRVIKRTGYRCLGRLCLPPIQAVLTDCIDAPASQGITLAGGEERKYAQWFIH